MTDPSPETSKYTVHPLMLIYPRTIEAKRTFVVDLRSNEVPLIVENSILVWALCALPGGEFSKDEAFSIWSGEEQAVEYLDEIWNFALEEGMILTIESAASMLKRLALWHAIGWDRAAIYHEGTRDYPFVDMSHKNAFVDDNERMKEYEEDGLAPPVYTSFPSLATVPLQKVDDEFNTYLKQRKERVDSSKDLSLLFDFCFGERLRLDHEFDERDFLQLESLRKTIPSGGGRHPTEVFIAVINNFMGLAKGLYHYNVHSNTLDLLNEIATEALQPIATLPEAADAVLFLASFCERAMWRYRDPRSWRAFVIDVGHLETMCELVCSSLQYSLNVCHDFKTTEAARFLKLDPLRTPVMSMATLRKAEAQ